MTMKRSVSTKDNIKKKPKLTVEDTLDYTKSLTSEDVDVIEIGDEPELNNAEIPEKIKSAKKAQASKKKELKTDKENQLLKNAKGKPNSTNGIFY